MTCFDKMNYGKCGKCGQYKYNSNPHACPPSFTGFCWMHNDPPNGDINTDLFDAQIVYCDNAEEAAVEIGEKEYEESAGEIGTEFSLVLIRSTDIIKGDNGEIWPGDLYTVFEITVEHDPVFSAREA